MAVVHANRTFSGHKNAPIGRDFSQSKSHALTQRIFVSFFNNPKNQRNDLFIAFRVAPAAMSFWWVAQEYDDFLRLMNGFHFFPFW
jgi:hypothetical protein